MDFRKCPHISTNSNYFLIKGTTINNRVLLLDKHLCYLMLFVKRQKSITDYLITNINVNVMTGEQMQVIQTYSFWIACLCPHLTYMDMAFSVFFLIVSDDNGKDGLRINDKESIPGHAQH